MQLWLHLKLYADNEYQSLLIHQWVAIEDKYIFISNSLFKELNEIAKKSNTKIDVIHIDIDDDTKIPTFHLDSKVAIDEEFLNKWHFLYFVASMKN